MYFCNVLALVPEQILGVGSILYTCTEDLCLYVGTLNFTPVLKIYVFIQELEASRLEHSVPVSGN